MYHEQTSQALINQLRYVDTPRTAPLGINAQRRGISVSDRGAIGDGVTDDTRALQEAILEAQESGSALYLPPARSFYRITDTLRITKPITVIGAGWQRSIVKKDPEEFIAIFIQSDTGATLEGVTLSGFAVDGSGFGQIDAGLIQVNRTRATLIDHVLVTNAQNFTQAGGGVNGIAIALSDACAVQFCTLRAVSKAGINWTTGGTNALILGNLAEWIRGYTQAPGIQLNSGFGGVVSSNTVRHNQGRGIILGNAQDAIITNNQVYRNGRGAVVGDGIAIVTSTLAEGRALITGNRVLDNGIDTGTSAQGILVQGDSDVQVISNWCARNTLNGIAIDNASSVDVQNNICQSNNQLATSNASGIAINDSDGVRIINNRCFDDQGSQTQSYGLLIQSGNTSIEVIDNDFSGNAGTGSNTGDILLEGGADLPKPCKIRHTGYRFQASGGGLTNFIFYNLPPECAARVKTTVIARDAASPATAWGSFEKTVLIRRDGGAAALEAPTTAPTNPTWNNPGWTNVLDAAGNAIRARFGGVNPLTVDVQAGLELDLL